MLSPIATSISAVAALGLIVPAYGAFSSECRNIRLYPPTWDHVLYAECPDSAGAYVGSTAFLFRWIRRTDQGLRWQTPTISTGVTNDNCRNATLDRTVFSCGRWAGPGNFSISSINIDEHFFNSNGTIKTDLLAPPTPSPHRNVRVPDSIIYEIELSRNLDCDSDGPVGPRATPIDCSDLSFYFGDANSVNFTVNPGLEFRAYSGNDCTGLVASVTPANSNQCIRFPSSAHSISALPLWNWV